MSSRGSRSSWGRWGSVSQFTHPFILHWSLTGLTSPTSIHWPYISTHLHKKSKDSRVRRVSKRIRSTGLCTVYIEAGLRVRISTATISAGTKKTTTKSPIPLLRAETESIYAQDEHMPHTLPRRPRTSARSRRGRSDCGRHERQCECARSEHCNQGMRFQTHR
jgi:hypothetical protein